MEAFTSVYPWTLRTERDRFLLVAFKHPQPFFVPKAAPEAASVVPVLRSALDRNTTLLMRVASDDPHRIVEARLEHPDQIIDYRCPEGPEMTREFWTKQTAVPRPVAEAIKWVGRPPGCSSYRVSYFMSAAFVWIHPQHPKADEMLAVAQRSIDERIDVVSFECEHQRNFLCDIKPSSP